MQFAVVALTTQTLLALSFDCELMTLRDLESQRAALKLKKLELQVHPFIEAYLNKGLKSPRRQWSKELNCKIQVTGISSHQLLQYALFTDQGEEIPV